MQIKISIIVPVYNAENFIDRCMQSIYAQTLSGYEIILVNDGSKDNSLAKCREYAEKDSRVTVIDKENGGAGSARNAGIAVAKGEYLAFPDVDDWFEPNMYEELYALAKFGDYDEVFSGVNYYAEVNGKLMFKSSINCGEKSYLSQKDCREKVMDFFPTSTIFDVPWNKLYKRSVAIEKNVRFADTRRCQDAMFNIDFYNAAEKVASCDKAYYNYIENTVAGFQRKFPKNYIDIVVTYYSHLKDVLSGWEMYKGDIKVHYDSSIAIAVYEAMEALDNPNWNLSKTEKHDFVKSIMGRKDVQKLLDGAIVRDDVKNTYKILIEQDEKAFFKNYRRKKMKDKLRQNKVISSLYRFVRGRKRV